MRTQSQAMAALATVELNVRALEKMSEAHFADDAARFRTLDARTRRIVRTLGRASDSTTGKKASGVSMRIERLWGVHLEERAEREVFRKRLLWLASVIGVVLTAVLGAVISLVFGKLSGKA